MLDDDPTATLKITFDNMPPQFQTFIVLLAVLIATTCIFLYTLILETLYKNIKSMYKHTGEATMYEQF